MDTTKRVSVWDRIYADFFMPHRYKSYREFLEKSLHYKYRICSIESFWGEVKASPPAPEARYLILRHDVDTDPSGARKMWEIERQLSLASSYYFRLSTLDVPLMQRIGESGGEASYHFEELATFAKHQRVRSRENILKAMPAIREMFSKNLLMLRKLTGLPMRVVAAHGDFVNRKLGIFNEEILSDHRFRHEVGVELECYDAAYLQHVANRYSDNYYPLCWMRGNPEEGFQGSANVIQVTLHPRHWRAHIRENLKFEVRRVWEGLRFAI